MVICDVCDKETIEEREIIFNSIKERLNQEEKKKDYILGMAGLGKI